MRNKKFVFLKVCFLFNFSFFTILRTFSSITQKYNVQIKNKVHHVNQLKKPDLIMCTDMPFS